MSELLNISHYVLGTKVLGPFNRNALWVSGCCFNCVGCIAEEMNKQPPKTIDINDLARLFLSTEAEGITISGGEPFLQSKALGHLVGLIKKERDYGVIVYSGFTLEELICKHDVYVNSLLEKIDILIDGKYIKALDDGKPYRGSSNQKIHLLTDRYKKDFEDYYYYIDSRNIEIKVTEDNVYIVGVPSENGLEVWRQFKKKADGDRDAI